MSWYNNCIIHDAVNYYHEPDPGKSMMPTLKNHEN